SEPSLPSFPRQAGIQSHGTRLLPWIPAFAGMTRGGSRFDLHNRHNSATGSQPKKVRGGTRMNQLSGVVVVSGAASGIGRASALHFADCGAVVVASDLNAEGLATLATDRIHRVAGDLTRDADCRRVAEAAAKLGQVT